MLTVERVKHYRKLAGEVEHNPNVEVFHVHLCAMLSVLERLPVTKDGVIVIPALDIVWGENDIETGGSGRIAGLKDWTSMFYSTREAYEHARQQEAKS